ncbi:helix-turn-helix transcriptional regulator [Marinobacterium maritimum]|uniref:Helix-turn-helix transcriptional regulator n=2 Tax=Marinobacterium maritimum TaxID=500162 RepID=A0ABP3TAD8_9GAMM
MNLDAGLCVFEGRDARRVEADKGDELQQAQHLLERLARISSPFVIMLDEFEVIQTPALVNFTRQMIENMPAGSVLVIASRSTPDIGLGRLRARGQLLDINPRALRFSFDETARFLQDNCQLALHDKEIATLYRCTEGWITAIYLASLSLQDRQDKAAFVASFSGSNLELAEYLTEDILLRQPEACRQFLLDSSVLSQLNVSLCAAVTGFSESDSADMLQGLERNNLFLVPLDSGHEWFRYHNLFASYLKGSLERRFPGRTQELHHRAAVWYLRQNRSVPAINHLLEGGAPGEAAEQIDLIITELTDAGRSHLLLRWVDRLPTDVLECYPRLCLAYAWSLALHRRYQQALGWVGRIEKWRREDGELFVREAQTIRCLVLVLTDRIEEGYQLCSQHIERMPEEEMFQYGSVANALAISMVATGRYDKAKRLLSRILLRNTQRNSNVMRTIAFGIEAVIDLLQGRLGTAIARLEVTMERNCEQSAGGFFGGKPSLDIISSLMLYELDELKEVKRRLSDAIPYAKESSPPDSLISCHILLARIAYLDGDRNGYERHLADLEQIGLQAGSSRIVCSAWLERTRTAILENRLDSAQVMLGSVEATGDWEEPDILFYANDVDVPSIARARLSIAKGEYTTTIDALNLAIKANRQKNLFRRLLKLRLLLALALDGLGDESQAFEEITEALRLASHEGFVRSFLDEGDALGALLQRWARVGRQACAGLGIEAHFLDRLLQRFADRSDQTAVTEKDQTDQQEVLTGRERQVIRFLAEGLSNKAIAEKMFLSVFTVKSHLRNINSKLGARGRTEAIAIARAQGLLK